MVDLEYLTKLIQLTKNEGLTHFKMAGLEFSLGVKTITEPTPPPAKQMTEQDMPPDLRADDTMSYDKILNWSGSSDPDEGQLPLTGEDDAPTY